VDWESSMHPQSFNISSEVHPAPDADQIVIEHVPNHMALDSSDPNRNGLVQQHLALDSSDPSRNGLVQQHLATCVDHLQGTLGGGVSGDWSALHSSIGLQGSSSIPRGLPVSPPTNSRGQSYSTAGATVPPLSPSRQWTIGHTATSPAPLERPSSPVRSPALGGTRVITPLQGVSHILDQSVDSSQLLVQPWVQRLTSAYNGSSAYGPFRMRSDASPRNTMPPQMRVMVRSPSHALQASSHSNLPTPAMPSGPSAVQGRQQGSAAQLGAGPFPGHGSPQLVASRCASRTPQTRQTFHATPAVASRAPTMVNCLSGDSAAPTSPMAMRTGSRSAVRLGF